MTGGESAFEVAELPDQVEGRGDSHEEVGEALELREKTRAVKADHVAASRADLLRAMMVSNVSLTPPASLAQAQRLASHRDALLATPVFTYGTLQQLRGDAQESSTLASVARRRDAHAVFTVSYKCR